MKRGVAVSNKNAWRKRRTKHDKDIIHTLSIVKDRLEIKNREIMKSNVNLRDRVEGLHHDCSMLADVIRDLKGPKSKSDSYFVYDTPLKIKNTIPLCVHKRLYEHEWNLLKEGVRYDVDGNVIFDNNTSIAIRDRMLRKFVELPQFIDNCIFEIDWNNWKDTDRDEGPGLKAYIEIITNKKE